MNSAVVWGVAIVAGGLLAGAGCSVQPATGASAAVTSSQRDAGEVGAPLVEVASVAPSSGPPPAPVEAGAADERQPGSQTGPCPAATDEVKRIFTHAVATANGERAMAEAVRLRLDALYQHGCYRTLDQAKLRAQLEPLLPVGAADESELYVELAGGDHVLVGFVALDRPWIALYGWKNGKIRSLMKIPLGVALVAGR